MDFIIGSYLWYFKQKIESESKILRIFYVFILDLGDLQENSSQIKSI